MEDKDLDDLLAELSQEIANTTSVSETEQESLRRLDADIHRLLARSEGEKPAAEPELLDEWQKDIEELEVEHPTLTKLISQVVEALSKAGI